MTEDAVAEPKDQSPEITSSSDASDEIDDTGPVADTAEPKHPIQKLMDNPWLLLALGLLIPILSYTVWGWIELMAVPPAQLP